jgi:hypothetical protein
LGFDEPTRLHVAIGAGYKDPNLKSFNNMLTPLKKDGSILFLKDQRISISDAGLRAVPSAHAAPTSNEESWEMIYDLFMLGESTKHRNIMKVLRDGKFHSRTNVANAVGCGEINPRSFQNTLSQLKTLELIQYPDPKSVQLVEKLLRFAV